MIGRWVAALRIRRHGYTAAPAMDLACEDIDRDEASPFPEALHTLLHDAADTVVPGADGLERIRARIDEPRRWLTVREVLALSVRAICGRDDENDHGAPEAPGTPLVADTTDYEGGHRP